MRQCLGLIETDRWKRARDNLRNNNIDNIIFSIWSLNVL